MLSLKKTSISSIDLTKTEALFLLMVGILSFGFIHLDTQEVWFAKLGICLPFPSNSTVVAGGTQQKLFITELFIMHLVLLVTLNLSFAKKKLGEIRNAGKFFLVLSFFFCFGLVELVLGPHLSFLAIRNAAFCWYLIIPILIYFLPIRKKVFAWLGILFALLALTAFIFSIVKVLFFGATKLYWAPAVGSAVFLSLFLRAKRHLISLFIASAMGFGLAYDSYQGYQRTTLVGMLFSFLFLILARRSEINFYFAKMIAFVLLTVALTFSLSSNSNLVKRSSSKAYTSNPLMKAESDSAGIETFRKQMWLDAWGLFLQKPFFGIGFEQQVVYRVQKNVTEFCPNDGKCFSEVPGVQTAQISGPHNSYLNALTRMGILAVLLPIIHLLAAIRLWKAELFTCFFVLCSQIIYSCFNVGLEGPVRSFFLLILLGAALKFSSAKETQNSP